MNRQMTDRRSQVSLIHPAEPPVVRLESQPPATATPAHWLPGLGGSGAAWPCWSLPLPGPCHRKGTWPKPQIRQDTDGLTDLANNQKQKQSREKNINNKNRKRCLQRPRAATCWVRWERETGWGRAPPELLLLVSAFGHLSSLVVMSYTRDCTNRK